MKNVFSLAVNPGQGYSGSEASKEREYAGKGPKVVLILTEALAVSCHWNIREVHTSETALLCCLL